MLEFLQFKPVPEQQEGFVAEKYETRYRTLTASCPSGFFEQIELVDPDGKGFADNHYANHLGLRHVAYHRERNQPDCGQATLTLGSISTTSST